MDNRFNIIHDESIIRSVLCSQQLFMKQIVREIDLSRSILNLNRFYFLRTTTKFLQPNMSGIIFCTCFIQ